MIKVECTYNIKRDLEFILEAEHIDLLELSERAKISRVTINAIISSKNQISDEVYEKLYSYIYKSNYRLNKTKEEIFKENGQVLFHGSKEGLKTISIDKSRENCDFGKGFYLGESYIQALSFVSEKENSSVYSFFYDLNDLKVKRFNCELDWMLAICFYRGSIKAYQNNQRIKKIIKEIDESDVIIAPIADNKMFYIMSQFAEGEINANIALHSLSASSLGLQYVFRTDKALNHLHVIEKHYISALEREDIRKHLNDRAFEVNTKLKLAKREYKDGPYIEELFK